MSRMKKAKVGDKSKKKAVLTALTEKPLFEDTLSVEGKEFYLLQIRNLEEQLDRYQVKCYELEVEKTDFSTRCSDLENEKRDIVQYLKRSLEKVEDELAGVTEHLASVQQAKEEGTDSLERQLGLVRQEYQEKHDKLASESACAAGKLAALKEFEEQRERLKADLVSLEKQLTNQKEEQSAAIYDLEKKAVLDNDRLRKEMVGHVASVTATLQQQSQRKMSETIQENVAARGDLAYLAEQARVLAQQNQALRGQEKQLRLDAQVLESLLVQISRRGQSNLQVVQQLTDRCKQLEAELKEQDSTRLALQQLQTEHTLLLDEMENVRRQQAHALEDGGKSVAEAEHLKSELKEERKRCGHVETILQEAASALKQALKEEKVEEEKVEVLHRRNQMMQKLLAVLDAATQLGTGGTVTDLLSERTTPTTPETTPATPGRAEGLNPRPSPPQAHFRAGDLGLVPRQTRNPSAVLFKVGPLSRTGHPHLSRRWSSQIKASHPPPVPASLPARTRTIPRHLNPTGQ